ncbi:MAG: AAA family ATPase [Syntrophaceae bacterium]|nr:AAA family ATPase [Syntrophaceae bacterium]
MEINLKKLRELIEKHARPRWMQKEKAWHLRDGGGEAYLQDILEKASPFLKKENIAKDARSAVLNALKQHYNLLAAYDMMYAIAFINQVDEESFKPRIRELLYGPEDEEIRLRRFLDWAKVESLPGEAKKKGFKLTVASYLLAMTDPRRYPFCKPSVYNKSSFFLIGEEAKKSDPVEKWVHCKEFYSQVLKLLEKDYGLVDGNLLDVHSLLYLFVEKEPPLDPVVKKPPPDAHLLELLMEKHNAVLYGPPGTGKTREAFQLAHWWRAKFGQESVFQVTFHPSYCYEDFIEGFRPTSDGSGFELKEGIFKRICKKASAAPDINFLIIIDEINRGDVARILGELITLIEGDKRGQNYATLLPISKEPFWVPENLYILGTMNTADKSISLMDLAIRRRFLFYPLRSNPSVLEDNKDFHQEIQGISLSQVLIGINQRLLAAGIDRDRELGHSFLIIPKNKENPLEILRNRFMYEIYPLIEEYCYADRSLVEKILGQMVDQMGILDEEIFDNDEKFIDCLNALSESK